MVQGHQASGAVEFVTDVVTRTFAVLVKVTIAMLLIWAAVTFGPSVLASLQGAEESKHIEFGYATTAPSVQPSPSARPSALASNGVSASTPVSPSPSE